MNHANSEIVLGYTVFISEYLTVHVCIPALILTKYLNSLYYND